MNSISKLVNILTKEQLHLHFNELSKTELTDDVLQTLISVFTYTMQMKLETGEVEFEELKEEYNKIIEEKKKD